ncbi:MAG: Lrp/AsnC family transcriptional regulator [Anaerolineales bacterium]
MKKIPLDQIDVDLLNRVQQNARLTNAELGKLVGLSPSGVQKRLRKLEESGVIEGYVTLLNRKKAGFDLLAFVKVTMAGHTPELIEEFDTSVQEMPEVLESHRIIGDADYLLKVVVRDREELDSFLVKRLLALKPVARVSSYLALKEVKETTKVLLSDPD